jgi:hypothetical protein
MSAARRGADTDVADAPGGVVATVARIAPMRAASVKLVSFFACIALLR